MRVNEPWPAYLGIAQGEWAERTEKARSLLASCRLCPRGCGVDRLSGEKGFCGAGGKARVASFNAHHGEEPPVSGRHGSGTIFFSHCNLRCVFCQNYPISHLENGDETDADELADMMMRLQHRGCHNINFVTPTHMMPFIVEALPVAVRLGLRLPLVYNCGGYESVEALKLLDGVVDIYMPDMKYGSSDSARLISEAPDYPRRNRAAVKEMHRQAGDLVLDEDGIAMRGLLIRHLVLPAGHAGSEGVLDFIARKISPNTAISLMSQYFPAYQAFDFPGLARRPSRAEYRQAVETMESLGLGRGWVQDPFYLGLSEDM
ncbi:MAG: radical SAM protein [bacterium]